MFSLISNTLTGLKSKKRDCSTYRTSITLQWRRACLSAIVKADYRWRSEDELSWSSIKERRLKPMDFIARLLQHVSSKGLHEWCWQEYGTFESIPHTSSVDRLSMVVYCKTYGVPAKLSRRWWAHRPKRISNNKEAPSACVCGSLQ